MVEIEIVSETGTTTSGNGASIVVQTVELQIQPSTQVIEILTGIQGPAGTPGSTSNAEVIIQHSNLNTEWIINSDTTYPTPTIHVTQIGSTVLEKSALAQTEWEYVNANQLRIKFQQECSGFVILHAN